MLFGRAQSKRGSAKKDHRRSWIFGFDGGFSGACVSAGADCPGLFFSESNSSMFLMSLISA
jgi:hypothetical protein